MVLNVPSADNTVLISGVVDRYERDFFLEFGHVRNGHFKTLY